ncbi:MAG: HD domain-containing protein, partial [Chromatiales bacterium]|nr:HD domain-containing protein [Chromatiales bacterium]
LTDDLKVRFAALVHDLGKGTTPESEWPRHIAHEDRGVMLVEKLCERLRVPKDFRDLAILVTKYHGLYHRAAELKASTMFKLLQNLDLFRRPERLGQFLSACEADSRGRTGFEEIEYEQVAIIRNAFNAASAVDSQAVIADGFIDKAIGEELEQRRIKAIVAANLNSQ